MAMASIHFISATCCSSTVLLLKWRRILPPRNAPRFTSSILISRPHSSLQGTAPQHTMEHEKHLGALPPLAWKRRLDAPGTTLKEFKPTFKEIFDLLGFIVRLWRFSKSEHQQGRIAPIDPFTRRNPPSACQGVPLGGIGGGSIGRGFKGDFMRWQLIPAHIENAAVPSDQFSVFIARQKDGQTRKISSVLCSENFNSAREQLDSGISSWDWKLSGQKSTYYALFPRAWTTYDGEPDPSMKITCRQVSPFIPHNYKESSFPSCAFIYELVNAGDEDATVTLLFTWANSIGESSDAAGGQSNIPFIEDHGVRGAILKHRKNEHSVTFGIAARQTDDVSVSVCPCFVVSGANNRNQFPSAKDIWTEITEKGRFDHKNWSLSSSTSLPGTVIGAAVAATVIVPAKGKKEVDFGLSWDSPEVKFMSGSSYFRRYTKFYGKAGDAASKIVRDALLNYKEWESHIIAWQNPILNDSSLPEWYRHTLFNELYYLVAGGTIWTDKGPDLPLAGKLDPREVPEVLLRTVQSSNARSSWAFPVPAEENSVGHFLYLEGVEYLYWNTYDVHFYASYALLSLFPKLQLQLQRDFAAAALSHNPEEVVFLMHGDTGTRTVFGAVPHDLGTHDPWVAVNSYNFYDTSKWKDLNCKFVIQAYRDAVATGDIDFARAVWPAVYTAVAYANQFDRDGDGMIENDGFPDQTYDVWTVKGVSAYCGGLWVAALQAASAMAELVGDTKSAKVFRAKFSKAKAVYEKSLWNGTYFDYDKFSSSIQSDQLAGQWYAIASALSPVVDGDKAASALQTVYDFNVMQFKGGNCGAVNGMLPSGEVDRTSMQSREVWTGSTYAAAAVMIQHGLREQAFQTAKGVFLSGWSEQGQGYSFQTPEAWDTEGRYRSLAYMRPLAIWAMQWALSPKDLQKEKRSEEAEHAPDDAAMETFLKLSQHLKQLSTAETKTKTKTYSSIWTFMFDLVTSFRRSLS